MRKIGANMSIPIMLAPYATLFIFFIAVPVFLAIILSFSYFNTIEFPKFVGMQNYIAILTQDETFIDNELYS